MYEREVSDQEQKINDMNKKGADEYDVRKQVGDYYFEYPPHLIHRVFFIYHLLDGGVTGIS